MQALSVAFSSNKFLILSGSTNDTSKDVQQIAENSSELDTDEESSDENESPDNSSRRMEILQRQKNRLHKRNLLLQQRIKTLEMNGSILTRLNFQWQEKSINCECAVNSVAEQNMVRIFFSFLFGCHFFYYIV